MGLAVLFRLGDDDSIARHKNERRDFALMDSFGVDESDDEVKVLKHPPKCDVTKSVEVEERSDALQEVTGSATEGRDATQSEGEKAAEDEVDQDVANLHHDAIVQEEPMRPETTDQHQELVVSVHRPEIAEDTSTKKKGLSVKERKLIKKYGSLEAAKRAAEEREKTEGATEVPETASVAKHHKFRRNHRHTESSQTWKERQSKESGTKIC